MWHDIEFNYWKLLILWFKIRHFDFTLYIQSTKSHRIPFGGLSNIPFTAYVYTESTSFASVVTSHRKQRLLPQTGHTCTQPTDRIRQAKEKNENNTQTDRSKAEEGKKKSFKWQIRVRPRKESKTPQNNTNWSSSSQFIPTTQEKWVEGWTKFVRAICAIG